MNDMNANSNSNFSPQQKQKSPFVYKTLEQQIKETLNSRVAKYIPELQKKYGENNKDVEAVIKNAEALSERIETLHTQGKLYKANSDFKKLANDIQNLSKAVATALPEGVTLQVVNR